MAKKGNIHILIGASQAEAKKYVEELEKENKNGLKIQKLVETERDVKQIMPLFRFQSKDIVISLPENLSIEGRKQMLDILLLKKDKNGDEIKRIEYHEKIIGIDFQVSKDKEKQLEGYEPASYSEGFTTIETGKEIPETKIEKKISINTPELG